MPFGRDDLGAGFQLSRRSLLKASLATAAIGAGTISLPRDASAQPARGGTVRLAHAHGSTTDSLDPASWIHDYTYTLAYATNNYLTEIDTDGSLKGEVSDEWEANSDATEWTFHIRSGIVFHSGTPVTAQDVAASFNHHRGEDKKSAVAGLVKQIVAIAAPDPSTVIFTLEAGNADFPYIVSDQHLPIKPATDTGIDWQSGIGCGAYVLKDFVPGVSAALGRFDAYWKRDRAWFDKIELLVVADASARATAFLTGQADIISHPELSMVDRISAQAGVRVEETSGLGHYTLPMLSDVAPFDNNDVRLALKFAIDRKAILDKILNGHGQLGNDMPIGIASRFHATEDELPQRPYDPEKARYHLKRAGIDRLAVQIHVADAAYLGAVDTAILYSESAKTAGIDIEVVREPNDGYWSNVWMSKPWCAGYWNGRATEDMMFSTAYQTGVEWNETHFSDQHFDELLLRARTELDDKLRREMYVEMQRIVHNQSGAVVPVFNNNVWARTDKIEHGRDLAKNMDLDGHRWSERWWRES